MFIKLAPDETAVLVHDATHENVDTLPPGMAAGYTTGSPNIKWTDSDWSNHPGAVRICQDSGTDDTADFIDDESGAATDTDVAVWIPKAQAAFKANKRPGQRWPGVYKSASGITDLVNTLIAHGIKSDVGLWIANWSDTEPQAIADVLNAAGPFPIVGVQFRNNKTTDSSVFGSHYLDTVSTVVSGRVHTFDGHTSIGDAMHSRNMHHIWAFLRLQRALSGEGAAKFLEDAVPPAGDQWRTIH